MPCGSTSFANSCATPGTFNIGLPSEWRSDYNAGYEYGVPQGCVIRNTFIEWQVYQGPSDADGNVACSAEVEDYVESNAPARRARSCPPSPVSDRSADAVFPVEETETQTSQSGGSAVEVPLGRGARRTNRRGGAMAEDENTWSAGSPNRGVNGGTYQATSPSSQGGQEPAALLLRGLPFSATEDEVLAFVKHCGISENVLYPSRPIIIFTNSAHRPSGFAEVRFAVNGLPDSDAQLASAREVLHMQRLGDRYIEVLPSRSKDSAWPSSPASRNHGHGGGARSAASRGSASHASSRKGWGWRR